jgi:hypothetical protein
MVIPSPALADHRPDDAIYEETRSHAGRDGAWSEQVTSCVGKDGTVYHRHLDRRADRATVTTRDSRSGDPSACSGNVSTDAAESTPSHSEAGDALVSTGDVTVSPGDIVLLGPPPERVFKRPRFRAVS